MLCSWKHCTAVGYVVLLLIQTNRHGCRAFSMKQSNVLHSFKKSATLFVSRATLQPVKIGLCASIFLTTSTMGPPTDHYFVPPSALAATVLDNSIGTDVRTVGIKDLQTKYYLAKSTTKQLKIKSFHDPKVQGVTLYLSGQNPDTTSISCAQTKKNIEVSRMILAGSFDDTDNDRHGEIVYREAYKRKRAFAPPRTTYFVVRRFYDSAEHVLIYDSYHLRYYTYDGNPRSEIASSICTVPLLQ